jgi:hypothetical protein
MVMILAIFLSVLMSSCEDAVDSVAKNFDTTESVSENETSIQKTLDKTVYQGLWVSTTEEGFLGKNNTIKIEDATTGLKMVTYVNPSASFEWHSYLLEQVDGGYHFKSDDIGIDFLITYDSDKMHLIFTNQKSLEAETFMKKGVE